MTGEEVLERACSEVVAAYRLGRRIDRLVPVSTAALALERAVADAERADARLAVGS